MSEHVCLKEGAIARLEEQGQTHTRMLSRIEVAVLGNGKPGIKQDVRVIGERLEAVEKRCSDVQAVKAQRRQAWGAKTWGVALILISLLLREYMPKVAGALGL